MVLFLKAAWAMWGRLYVFAIVTLGFVILLRPKRTIAEPDGSLRVDPVADDALATELQQARTSKSLDRIKADVATLVNAFGWNYSAWSPQSWYEDEDVIVDTLLPYTRADFPLIASHYARVAARDLVLDLGSYLEPEQREPLGHLL